MTTIQLKRDRSIDGERLCPACRHPLPDDAVLCVHCGTDLKTGAPIEAPPERKGFRPPWRLLLGLVAAAGVAAAGFTQRDRLKSLLEKQPAPLPEVAAIESAGHPQESIPEGTPAPPSAPETGPAMPPEDAPRFGAIDLLNAAEGYKESVAAALQRNRPLVETNNAIDLRLVNGQVRKGLLRSVAADHLVIDTGAGTETLSLAMVDPRDRLRCDPLFRDRWVHFRSIAYARNEYTQSGLTVPAVAIDGADAAATAIEMGDPAALIQAARRHLASRDANRDLSFAYLYLGCAALQRDPQAQHLFGLLHFNGVGIGKNVDEGLRWISLAAAEGHAPANAFLQKHQINQERAALARVEAQRRQEKESREFAARLEELRQRDLQRDADPIKSSGLQGPRKVSRSLLERYPHWTDSRGRTYICHPDGRVSLVSK